MPSGAFNKGNPQDRERNKFDQWTGAVNVISEEHKIIHDGHGYVCSTLTTGILNGATAERLIRVPAGVSPHLRKFTTAITSAPCTIELFEGATITAPGTLVDTFNANRNSTNTASTLIYANPTISADGTRIDVVLLPEIATGGGGGPGGGTGGSQGPDVGEEWILKPATDYIIRLTNNSGASCDANCHMFWYELSYNA